MSIVTGRFACSNSSCT